MLVDWCIPPTSGCRKTTCMLEEEDERVWCVLWRKEEGKKRKCHGEDAKNQEIDMAVMLNVVNNPCTGFPSLSLSSPSWVLWPKNAKHAVYCVFWTGSSCPLPAFSLWQHTNIVSSLLKSYDFLNRLPLCKKHSHWLRQHQIIPWVVIWVHNLECVAVLSDTDGWCFPIKWPFSGEESDEGKYLFTHWFRMIRAEACKIWKLHSSKRVSNLLGAASNNHSKCPDGCHLEAVWHYWSQLVLHEPTLAAVW